MNQVKLRNNVFIPMPVSLVGTTVKDKVNFMAVGWVTRVNANPPMIAIGIGRQHYTSDAIIETKEFSVCFPTAKMIKVTDYCGLVSGKKVDKSNVFEIFFGEKTAAPMIEDCPLNLECRMAHTMTLPTNNLFIGEIVGAYAQRKCITDNALNFKEIDPVLLTMPDNTYWNLGAELGKAWKIGKELI